MRRLYSGTIVFEVPYEGNHYLIDSQCGDPAMYDGSGVPRAVVDRAISAVESAYVKTWAHTGGLRDSLNRRERPQGGVR